MNDSTNVSLSGGPPARDLGDRSGDYPPPVFEPLEPRLLLSATLGGEDPNLFRFTDGDGDEVIVRLAGPGTATIDLVNGEQTGADIDSILLADTTAATRLTVTVRPNGGAGDTTIGSITSDDSVGLLHMPRAVISGPGIALDGSLGVLRAAALQNGTDVLIGEAAPRPTTILLGSITGATEENRSIITTPGGIGTLRIGDDAALFTLEAGEGARLLHVLGDLSDAMIDIGGGLRAALFRGDVTATQLAVAADLGLLHVFGDTTDLALDVEGDSRATIFRGDAGGVQISVGGDSGLLRILGEADGVNVDILGSARAMRFLGGASDLGGRIGGDAGVLHVRGDADRIDLHADGSMRTLLVTRFNGQGGHLRDSRISAGGEITVARIAGDFIGADGSILSAGRDIRQLFIGGGLSGALAGAGALYDPDSQTFAFAPATIHNARIGGDVVDAILAAGGDPDEDGLFTDGDVLPGGLIRNLRIGGRVVGTAQSPHANPGVYTADINRLFVNGVNFTRKPAHAAAMTAGTGVIDPLPSLDNALAIADIEAIIARAVARADQLGVAATLSIVDREGNILALARMDGAEQFVDIDAGGEGGLEAVDGIVQTSLVAATKAGTASFLSTSIGNAFTTRTAGYIIQKHFPPGVRFQPSGPLFGVQLSNLPTSDMNRLPLGLSADPGGLPLYRGGELIGGIGVEVDATYTVDPTRIGGSATSEELIALAGQATLAPPPNIRADRVFVDGRRLAYANAAPPSIAALGPLPDFSTLVAAGDLDLIVEPRISPESKFEITALDLPSGVTLPGEVPDNDLVSFIDSNTGDLAFLAGDDGFAPDGTIVAGSGLTTEEVQIILAQGHDLNRQLRAMIRRDSPRVSQVTVSVVDANGNLLGVFRNLDAPVFGYDVSAQKARTAAFMSRPDAGDALRDLDAQLAAFAAPRDLATLQLLGVIDPSIDDPFGRHVDAAQAIGVNLDGSVAVSDRAGGFLSRPNLPDGILGAPPGPFTALAPDRFSPFNTGLQTALILPNLVDLLVAFNTMDEADAFAAFIDGTLGGPSVVPNEDTGGGLPASSLANGLQIFPGSVPLYKDGVLVGGVGVSGDGIEQDDFVAFSGARGFQEFGEGVRRSDFVRVGPNGVRLPYVKFPRAPTRGI